MASLLGFVRRLLWFVRILTLVPVVFLLIKLPRATVWLLLRAGSLIFEVAWAVPYVLVHPHRWSPDAVFDFFYSPLHSGRCWATCPCRGDVDLDRVAVQTTGFAGQLYAIQAARQAEEEQRLDDGPTLPSHEYRLHGQRRTRRSWLQRAVMVGYRCRRAWTLLVLCIASLAIGDAHYNAGAGAVRLTEHARTSYHAAKTGFGNGVDAARLHLEAGLDAARTGLDSGVDVARLQLEAGLDAARTRLGTGLDAARASLESTKARLPKTLDELRRPSSWMPTMPPNMREEMLRAVQEYYGRMGLHLSSEDSKDSKDSQDGKDGKDGKGGKGAADADAIDALPPPDSSDVADYLNYLVDQHGLAPDLRWAARRVQPSFDSAGLDAAAAYPTADDPVDRQGAPWLSDAGARLLPRRGGGFAAVHAPGYQAFHDREMHEYNQNLDDAGDWASPDERGLTKTELRRLRQAQRGTVDQLLAAVAEAERQRAELLAQLQKTKHGERGAVAKRDAGRPGLGLGLEPGLDPNLDPGPSTGIGLFEASGAHEADMDANQPRVKRPTEPLPPIPDDVLRLPVSGRGMRTKLRAQDEARRLTAAEAAEAAEIAEKALSGTDGRRPRGTTTTANTAGVDASAVLVGISSTYARLSDGDSGLVDGWARWMTDGHGHSNGLFLLLALHRPRGDECGVVDALLTERGIAHLVVVDVGDDREGAGGGPQASPTAPVVPDDAAVRYANLLVAMTEFGRGPADDVRGRTVYGLLEDDVFVPDLPALLAKLREHGGIVDDADDADDATKDSPAPRLDPDLYLGFPSDPWSDWTFHNGTTHDDAYRQELAVFGRPLDTAGLAPEYRRRVDVHAASAAAAAFDVDALAPPLWPTSFGGGAVFLAPSLARRMAVLPCLRRSTADGFVNRLHRTTRDGTLPDGRPAAPAWDEQLFRCASRHLVVGENETSGDASDRRPAPLLRIVPSFYAPSDAALYGGDTEAAAADPRGFGRLLGRMQQLTGGTRPLVMHSRAGALHARFDAATAHQVADVCGDACFLQRFRFADDWLLVNGHSLTHYPAGLVPCAAPRRAYLPALGLLADSGPVSGRLRPLLHLRADHQRRLDAFYASQNLTVEHAVRPGRSRSHADTTSPSSPSDVDAAEILDWAGRRQTYRLLDTSVAVDGTVLQAYVRRRARPGQTDPDDAPAAAARAAHDATKRYAAPPPMVDGGLESDALDRATEDAPPSVDEVVVLLWQPHRPSPPSSTSTSTPSPSPLATRLQAARRTTRTTLIVVAWFATVAFVFYRSARLRRCLDISCVTRPLTVLYERHVRHHLALAIAFFFANLPPLYVPPATGMALCALLFWVSPLLAVLFACVFSIERAERYVPRVVDLASLAENIAGPIPWDWEEELARRRRLQAEVARTHARAKGKDKAPTDAAALDDDFDTDSDDDIGERNFGSLLLQPLAHTSSLASSAAALRRHAPILPVTEPPGVPRLSNSNSWRPGAKAGTKAD